MALKPETYPAVYIIFTLLNSIRRGIERKNVWREHLHRTAFGAVQVFRRQKVVLKPRLAFWVSICQKAGLLNHETWKVTGYARAWLNKTPEEQTFQLIKSWQTAPRHYKTRQFRKKLLWKFKYDQPLTAKDLGAVNGLEAFGLVAAGKLTQWGRFFIRGEGDLPTPQPVVPCKIHEDHFLASLPQHVDLLWEIEKYLRPRSPGRYALTMGTLHLYKEDPQALIELMEKGLQAEVPERTKATILHQPSIRYAEGIMLEFSDPEALRQLRRQPALRKYVDEFLSPQRVLVSTGNATALFKMLKRRGVYIHLSEEQVEVRKKRTHFQHSPKTMLQPIGRSTPKTEVLEMYQRWEQALDVWYRAPGYPAEQRRITPLSIEQRGEHTYVIARSRLAATKQSPRT